MKLVCDASKYGIGGIMSHITTDGRVYAIVFDLYSLIAAEKNHDRQGNTELGFNSKIFQAAFCKGRLFTLITGHQPQLLIFNAQKLTQLHAFA